MTYSVKEELANSVSHGLGVVLGLFGLGLMLLKLESSAPMAHYLSVGAYGFSLTLLFLASTLYHASSNLDLKALFKRFDHSAIYLLIAGSYTPFLVVTIDSQFSYWMLLLIWSIAGVGVLLKNLFIHRFKRLSLLTYIGMGWISLFIVPALYRSLDQTGLYLLAAGGLTYTAGTYFYAQKSKAYSHAIWHLMVLAGAGLHFASIYLYVL